MRDRSLARIRCGFALGVLGVVLPLSGCLQTWAQPVCPPAAQAVPDGVRMVVSFRQAVSAEAPETLRQLQVHAGACVGHIASISPTVHVFGFSGVRDPALLGQRLRAWPLVQDAVPDARVQPQR